jgi:hypothetical protein
MTFKPIHLGKKLSFCMLGFGLRLQRLLQACGKLTCLNLTKGQMLNRVLHHTLNYDCKTVYRIVTWSVVIKNCVQYINTLAYPKERVKFLSQNVDLINWMDGQAYCFIHQITSVNVFIFLALGLFVSLLFHE